MLQIIIPASPAGELWDEESNEFVYTPEQKEQILQLEHSLISLSKWESKWCKPFFSDKEKTMDETIDYIRCMTLNKNIDRSVYDRLTEDNFQQISDYIYAPMTATTINDRSSKSKNREIITSELIYYWMIANTIPFECEKWHLNRLITLIRVCSAHNEPPKKMSKRDVMRQYSELNAARRKKYNSKG
nr:hypothetical protein [uncultured Blautia sp.]